MEIQFLILSIEGNLCKSIKKMGCHIHIFRFIFFVFFCNMVIQ